MLDEYTPSYFDFTKNNKYILDVNTGKNIAKDKTLVICGLLRDRQEKVDDIRKRIEKIKPWFKQIKVLIVENDSDDDTRKNLVDWAKQDPETLTVLGCGVNSDECKLSLPKTLGHYVDSPRLQKMTFLRNIYHEEIQKYYSTWDYVLVWDMDLLGSLYIDGMLSSINMLNKKEGVAIPDAVCSNGIYVWPGFQLYYDTFAHDEINLQWIKKFNKTVQDVIKSIASKFNSIYGDEERQVVSCFSGATIYKTQAFLKNKYETDGIRCEHDSISKGNNMFINKNMINYVLLND